MNSDVNVFTTKLKTIPVLSSCSSQSLARIIPQMTEIKLETGQYVFQLDSPATHLYVILDGGVKLISDDKEIKEISAGLVGEEAAIGKDKYISDAITSCPTHVLSIPNDSLKMLLDDEPQLIRDFYSSLFNHFTGKELPHYGAISPVNEDGDQEEEEESGLSNTIGWLLAILVPAAVLLFSSDMGLDWNSRLFLCVLSAAIIMWTFSLTPSFLIPGILVILVLLFLGVAPPSVVLSGFTSGSFFMAMSVFGLTVVLIASGATYRLVLVLLKYIPPYRYAYTLVMFLTGFLITPVIPTYSGRVTIMGSPIQDIVNALGYRPSGKAATQLITAAYTGTTHFASVFLTGTSLNFLIYGLLPQQVRTQFTWGGWFLAAAVFTAVSVVAYLILLTLMFRSDETPQLSRDKIETQLEIMGPLSAKEWAAIGGVLLFIIGVITSSIHKIDTPWIGLAVLYIFLALGVLQDKEFKKGINWSFLIYLGAMIGLVDTMSYLGLDQWLVYHFGWMSHYLQENIYLFIFMLTISIALLGFVIDEYTTITFFAAVLFPMALLNGINPWVMGFIILTSTGWWVLPYQDPDFILFSEITNSKNKIFNIPWFLKFNSATIVIQLIAIYISIPFWFYMGLL
ncbi:MAG: cyclic nucleotide-binding domain-containing protein [Firmicutes bacterium]|nr:cyclic nucleotide-binding domain-containing protein [Bacillota bacterium]